MRRVYKNLCPATIIASIMAANMWKNSLKNVESDNNNILYETSLKLFLQRNGTYLHNSVYHNNSTISPRGWQLGVETCTVDVTNSVPRSAYVG